MSLRKLCTPATTPTCVWATTSSFWVRKELNKASVFSITTLVQDSGHPASGRLLIFCWQRLHPADPWSGMKAHLIFFFSFLYIRIFHYLRYQCHRWHNNVRLFFSFFQCIDNPSPVAHSEHCECGRATPFLPLSLCRIDIYTLDFNHVLSFLPLSPTFSFTMPKKSPFQRDQLALLDAKIPEFIKAVNKFDPLWKGNSKGVSVWLQDTVEELLDVPAFATFQPGFSSREMMVVVSYSFPFLMSGSCIFI